MNRSLILSCLIMLAAADTAAAQQASRFVGTVHRSDTKDLIPKATVMLTLVDATSADTNRKATTDEKGRFSFEELKPGTYSLSVHAVFESLEKTPCREGPLGFLRPMAQKGWFVVTTRTSTAAVQQLVKTDNVSVASGQEVTKDVDISCRAVVPSPE